MAGILRVMGLQDGIGQVQSALGKMDIAGTNINPQEEDCSHITEGSLADLAASVQQLALTMGRGLFVLGLSFAIGKTIGKKIIGINTYNNFLRKSEIIEILFKIVKEGRQVPNGEMEEFQRNIKNINVIKVTIRQQIAGGLNLFVLMQTRTFTEAVRSIDELIQAIEIHLPAYDCWEVLGKCAEARDFLEGMKTTTNLNWKEIKNLEEDIDAVNKVVWELNGIGNPEGIRSNPKFERAVTSIDSCLNIMALLKKSRLSKA